MTDAIVLLANEIQDKDEQIDRLTAERDSFKACYDISFQEASRLRKTSDRQREEIADMRRSTELEFDAPARVVEPVSDLSHVNGVVVIVEALVTSAGAIYDPDVNVDRHEVVIAGGQTEIPTGFRGKCRAAQRKRGDTR